MKKNRGKRAKNRKTNPWRQMGRRDFLRGAAGGIAALGMGRLVSGCGSDDSEPPPVPQPQDRRTYFFDLRHANPRHEFYLSNPGGSEALLPMGDSAWEELQELHSWLKDVPREAITHYGHFELPAERMKLCYVYGMDRGSGVNYVCLAFFHFPPDRRSLLKGQTRTTVAALRRMAAENKLRFLGVDTGTTSVTGGRASDPNTSGTSEPSFDVCTSASDLKCLYDLACTMTNMHLEALSMDTATTQAINTYISSLATTTPLAYRLLDLVKEGDPTKILPDGSINLGWAVQYPIPDPAHPGTYRKYSSGARKGQTIYTVVYADDDALRADLNTNINATLEYVKNTYYVNTTGGAGSVKTSSLKGKLCQVRDGTPHVVQSSGAASAAVSRTASSDASSYTYTFRHVSNQQGMKTSLGEIAEEKVKFVVTNWYVRYLCTGVQFLDASGNPIKISELAKSTQDWANGTQLGALGANTDDTVVMSVVTPEMLVFGIPVEQSESEFEVPIDPSATAIRVLNGGLGSNGDVYEPVTGIGIAFTSVFNLAIPTLFLVSNAVVGYETFSEALTEEEERVIDLSMALYEELATFIASMIGKGELPLEEMAVELGETLFSLLSKPAFAWLGGEIIAAIGGGEAATATEEATPIVGWILLGVEIAALVASLAETIAEVILSPFSFVSELVLTHDVSMTVLPSNCPVEGQTFPAELWSGTGGYYEIKLVFDNASAITSGRQSILSYSHVPSSDPIQYTFTNVPYGGTVAASVAMYSSDGYLMASSASGSVPNEQGTVTQDSSGSLATGCADPGPDPDQDVTDKGGKLAITLRVNEKKIPLTTQTQYQFLQKSALDATGNHIWDTANEGASVPSATAADLSPETQAGKMMAVYSITVNEVYQGIGYSWRSSSQNVSPDTQVGLFANLSMGSDPQTSYLLSSDTMTGGLPGSLPVNLNYNLLNNPGNNFFIDTSNGTNMVRKIVFSDASSPPTFSTTESYGQFALPSDAFIVHPSGILYSVNTENSKVERIKLADYQNLPVADADAPVAESFSGNGSREGLLDGPVLIAVGADGTIFVLEAGNGRIQAFDSGLSPFKQFHNKTSYYLSLKDGASTRYTYVGLAVEYTGYVYVLSYDNSTYTYRLDIYTPDGDFLTRTEGVNAGALAVDFWRTVYTLNYEVLKEPNDTLPGVTEPSVSLWLP